jgi:DNA-binding Lrp family transcriptional regulator
MTIGFVLIKVAPSHEHKIYNKLSNLSEIIKLHPLFGEYDFIAKIEAENNDKLGGLVVNKIRSIDGVVNTKTLTGTKF